MPRKRTPLPEDKDLARFIRSFAKNLKSLRDKADLSQQELASKAGLSTTTVYELENARVADIRLGTIVALARALGKPPLGLLNE